MTKTQFLLEVRQTRKAVSLGSAGQLDAALIEKQFLEKEKARLLRKNAPRLQRAQGDWKSLQEKRTGVLMCLTPKIKETDPPPIEPTDTVRLTGCGFGKDPGEVRLLGAFPGGSLKLPVKHYTYPSGPYWYDGMIDVVVPSVSAVNDHQAQLQVTTKSGKTSNLWPIKFQATRSTQVLPFTAFQVSCSSAAPDGNNCNDKPSSGFTAKGFHMNKLGLSAGSDAFTTSLANGWYFDDFQFGWDATPWNNQNDTIASCTHSEFVPSPNTVVANFKVTWLTYGGQLHYSLKFVVTGPLGVEKQ
jgi:hypothetical protein